MKNIKKIISAVLILSMLAIVLSACGKGMVYATYDGGAVYQSDIDGWVKYTLAVNQVTQQEEVDKIVVEVTQNVVMCRLYEKVFAREGIKVSADDIAKKTEEYKRTFDYIFSDTEEEDGYAAWKKAYGTTDKFFKEFIYAQVLNDMIKDYLYDNYEVSDEESRAYYGENVLSYIKTPGYYFDAVLVEVKNRPEHYGDWVIINDAAKNYIKRIQLGESYETVKKEILDTYSIANGYVNANIVSGSDWVKLSDLITITDEADLEAKLEAAKNECIEKNGPMDPSAEESSDELTSYLIYLGTEFKYKFMYALQHEMTVGQVYDKPIKCPYGYFIYRLNEYNAEEKFPEYSEMRDEIIEKIKDEAWDDGTGDMLADFQQEIADEYSLEIIVYQAEESN